MSSGSLENDWCVSLIKVGAKLCRKVDLTSHIGGVTDMPVNTNFVGSFLPLGVLGSVANCFQLKVAKTDSKI